MYPLTHTHTHTRTHTHTHTRITQQLQSRRGVLELLQAAKTALAEKAKAEQVEMESNKNPQNPQTSHPSPAPRITNPPLTPLEPQTLPSPLICPYTFLGFEQSLLPQPVEHTHLPLRRLHVPWWLQLFGHLRALTALAACCATQPSHTVKEPGQGRAGQGRGDEICQGRSAGWQHSAGMG